MALLFGKLPRIGTYLIERILGSGRLLGAFVMTAVYVASPFFSSRRLHTRYGRDWSSDVCSSDLAGPDAAAEQFGAVAADRRVRQDGGLVAADDEAAAHRRGAVAADRAAQDAEDVVVLLVDAARSEERRVGKEGRSRWSPYH